MQKEYLLYRPLLAERARLRLHGPDARRFLHGMVSNDISGLKAGQGCHAALLTVKGKLLGDLVVYDLGDFGLIIEIVKNAADAVRKDLERHLIMDDATVTDLSASLGELGVYGEGAAAGLSAAGLGDAAALSSLPTYHLSRDLDADLASDLPTFVAATRELGVPGFHVLAPVAMIGAIGEKLAGQGGAALSESDAEVMRVEAGVPIYGRDLDEDRMPAEAGLDDAVSFTKGCYLGQEVVVRLRDRGHLNRKLCGLQLSGDGVVAPGTRLGHADRPNAGVITSSVVSPRFGAIALGYVHRSVWEPGTTLTLTAVSASPSGQTETLLDRTAQVVPLPFLPPANR